MKKALQNIFGILTFMLVSMSAHAIYVDNVDVYTIGDTRSGPVTISWSHFYDGSQSPEDAAFLTIVAEGVDYSDATLQENDAVYFNGHLLGDLVQQSFYNSTYDINPGAGALGAPLTELTTSVFALDLTWLINGFNEVDVVVDSSRWIMEVETSMLTVTSSVPEPSTLLMLGLGLIGLRFASSRQRA